MKTKKKTKWLILRYVFDEHSLQFKHDMDFQVIGDDALLKFVRNIISKSNYKTRWKITYFLDSERIKIYERE